MTSNKHSGVRQNNYSHPTGTLLRYAHNHFMSLRPSKFQTIVTNTEGGGAIKTLCDKSQRQGA